MNKITYGDPANVLIMVKSDWSIRSILVSFNESVHNMENSMGTKSIRLRPHGLMHHVINAKLRKRYSFEKFLIFSEKINIFFIGTSFHRYFVQETDPKLKVS